MGVKILFDEGLIKEFVEDRRYDELIRKAILNHNRARIEFDLNEKELLHAKIIRDADKVDIFYSLTVYSKEAVWESPDLSDEIISDKIFQEFKEDKIIEYKDRVSHADGLICHFAYVYDFNFKYSLQIIYRNNYIDKLYKRHTFKDEETMKRYDEIYELAKKYVEEKAL